VLSRELGARKIRVNALNPGIVETEGTHAAGFICSAPGLITKREVMLRNIPLYSLEGL
jgi:NAD(P)-dependent dehydrogenase (short-subunit alcohol dehydrogenase family)